MGADVNIRANNGASPLHFAASEGRSNIVDYLLKYGADVNIIRNDGASPLHFAASEGHSNTVEYLLKFGADVNVRKIDGTSPLHSAVSRGCSQIADYLLKHGADVNVRKNNGASPLHEAALRGYSQSVKLLLNYGASVINSRDKDGRTALHYACSKGHLEAVKLLLEYGSDINIICKNGCTALDDSAAWRKSLSLSDHYEFDCFKYKTFYESDCSLAEQTIKYIIHHIIKMESAKFPVCQENIQKKNLIRYYIDFNDANERDFQLQCVEELESIKRKEIGINYEQSFQYMLVY